MASDPMDALDPEDADDDTTMATLSDWEVEQQAFYNKVHELLVEARYGVTYNQGQHRRELTALIGRLSIAEAQHVLRELQRRAEESRRETTAIDNVRNAIRNATRGDD